MKEIAYFSYKGGSGRSSLAYNTIPMLATKLNATNEEPIILLDLDVDSAGLTYLLQCNNRDKYDYTTQDLVSGKISGMVLTPDEVPIAQHPLFKNLIPMGRQFGLGYGYDRAILFLPVRPDQKIKTTYDADENYLSNFARLCRTYNCKALILDTPAGDQMVAKWSLEVASDILTVMKITYQFRIGTMEFLKRKDSEYCDKNFIIVPNCVPTEEIVVDGVVYNYPAVKNEIVDRVKENVKNNTVNLGLLEGDLFGVPEVKRFKLKEGILAVLDPQLYTEDEKAALAVYNKLVEII